MKLREQIYEDYLSKYSDHHCTLIKKYRTVFHYVLVLRDKEDAFKIHVGQALYSDIKIGQRLTIGRIGKRLINIRLGYCKIDSDS